MRRLLFALSLLAFAACPQVNSQPCTENADCPADKVCRRGACGPICLLDADCGSDQVCRNGSCAPTPQCAKDTDCASGFSCTADRCQCIDDGSCGANETCEDGTCTATKRCTADADCAGSGKRCEVSQGVCLDVCRMPQDCAPGLDPNLAFTLYSCVQGTCTRRCLNDLTCGGAGFVCASGLCAVADCKTKSDCGETQYCSSATFGRCLEFVTCTADAQCPTNSQCRAFESGQCPPGFDCSKKICQELPRCLIDQDCVTLQQGMGGGLSQTGYCAEGHCQPSQACAGLSCGAGLECIAALCVPATCRGLSDCPAGQGCVDGACALAPEPGQVNLLQLRPLSARVEVGDTLQLTAIAFRLSGASYPLNSATFTVTDQQGMPSAAATLDASGRLTGVSAGVVQVQASLSGSAVVSTKATVEVVAQVTAGRRVLVVDQPSLQPLGNVKVLGCLSADCAAPIEVITAADGLAAFPALGSGPATFTAVSQEVRMGDGLPRYTRVSVIDTAATDVYLPLEVNPTDEASGFNASVSFADVKTSGTYWAGFVASAVADLPSWGVPTLLGENFSVQIPGINQNVPVPGPLVLYTSPGFGFPQEVKAKSLGLGQPGTPRHAIAFAGRTTLDQVTSLRSTAFLSYLGAFDFSVALDTTIPSRQRVPDTTDIDGDGLCSNQARCPMGSEVVPDYAQFAQLSFAPNREQKRRTEVVVPKLPSTLDQVVVASLEVSEAGALPTGFANGTVGTVGQDGTRAVEPVVLRSGPPYGGLERSKPGVLVLAGSNDGNSSSARVAYSAVTPRRVLVAPFLPVPEGGSYAAATRTFSPGQPEWASVYSTGGELARLSITGSQNRHTFYFPIVAGQTSVVLPPTPMGPGLDPTTQSSVKLDVVAMDLQSSTNADEVFSLKGANLSSLTSSLDGFARWQK